MSENIKFILILSLILGVAGWFGNDFFIALEKTSNSESKGTAEDGSILRAKRLPSEGANFETYSRLGSTIGRTCVHNKVRTTTVGAYEALEKSHAENVFVFGETGWCLGGGEFSPHRTHQNGTSVDFMVPVRKSGKSVMLPHSIIDGWGYKLEFSETGKVGDYEIDFDAMAAHLLALRAAAKKEKIKIKRVILAPELQKLLFKAKDGKKVKKLFKFNKKAVWVRHDDHYHVDFDVPAEKAEKK